MSFRLYHPANNWFCRFVILLLIPITFNGCASYVNIPADGRDTAINAVNLPPVPAVMSEALAYAIAKYPLGSAYCINLPYNSNDRTYRLAYEDIIEFNGAEGLCQTECTTNETQLPYYQLISVRIRGNHAIVNILLPESLAERRLLVLGLNGSFSGWNVISVQQHYPTSADIAQAKNQLIPPITVKPVEKDVVNNDDIAEPDTDTIIEIGDAADMTEVLSEPENDAAIKEITEETKKTEDPLKPIVVEEIK